MPSLRLLLYVAILCSSPLVASAGDITALTQSTFKANRGVVLLQVNWGRKWPCGKFENAQIEALTFTQWPPAASTPVVLSLETPSRLMVDNSFVPYALVVAPGQYALSGYDVKAAHSKTDVGHFHATTADLIKDGKPLGGTFSVSPGEIVYIGHFGLDCKFNPIPWRYYVEGRDEFERYVSGFRKKFPFAKDTPVQYRLFSTKMLGEEYGLENPTVK